MQEGLHRCCSGFLLGPTKGQTVHHPPHNRARDVHSGPGTWTGPTGKNSGPHCAAQHSTMGQTTGQRRERLLHTHAPWWTIGTKLRARKKFPTNQKLLGFISPHSAPDYPTTNQHHTHAKVHSVLGDETSDANTKLLHSNHGNHPTTASHPPQRHQERPTGPAPHPQELQRTPYCKFWDKERDSRSEEERDTGGWQNRRPIQQSDRHINFSATIPHRHSATGFLLIWASKSIQTN